jgi:hypothetical protein
MKKIIVFVLSIVLLGSCTVTQYFGEIYPNRVEFNKANFKYLKTIKGSATAKFGAYGWDKKRADGLINEAKSNMYLNHSFQANQVVTNITKDILKVTDTKGFGSREVKVIVTGDVFEFSENGIYSGVQKVEKPEGLDVINEKIINPTSTKKETIEVISNSSYIKYSKTPELNDVVYYLDYYTKEYIKGKIIKLSNNSNSVLVQYLTKNGGNKKRYIEIDLLFQK